VEISRHIRLLALAPSQFQTTLATSLLITLLSRAAAAAAALQAYWVAAVVVDLSKIHPQF
jgi:hypothetical protein